MSLKVSVFGTGYLGATHAAGMAELGHQVVGIDVDANKIAQLQKGQVPFYEPGLPELLEKHVTAGNLTFTTDATAAADADVHFIGVGTPQKAGEHAADMSYVDAVIETLGPLLTKPALILGKSTVPVGSAARLRARVRELAPAGDAVELAWNPEFLREGFGVEDTLRPDRIVLGVADPESEVVDTVRKIYAEPLGRGTPFLVTDLATSELVKVAANAFLATKISFINGIAEVCEAADADVVELARAIGYDDRIGHKFLGAGLGFGGGCLPKDIRAFMARAGELGVDQALSFLREVDVVNLRRREHVINLAQAELDGSVAGKRVAVLGAAFKPNSDDVRDSPALDVAGKLHLAGAHVSVYDPKGMVNAAKVFPTLNYTANLDDALSGADLVIVATEWAEFKELDPVHAFSLVNTPKVIDGRNCLPVSAWIEAGWDYRGLGRYSR